MTVGDRLAELLSLRGMRASELARRSGVRQQTIYSMLNRKSSRASPATLQKLAQALDAPVDYFFDAAPMLPVRRRAIPLLGDVAAGKPIFAEEIDDESADASGGGADFALLVSGVAIAPRIRPGDIVFVKKRPDVRDGQIAVVIVDGEATLKRVYRVPGGVQLVSDNSDYAPMLFTEQNSDCVRILGRAVSVKSDL